MASPAGQDDGREICELVRKINEAWVQGRPEELAEYFHRDMVILHPDLETRAAGRAACVEGYADFCRQATIHRFEPSEPAIEVFGETAIAVYRWEIAYEMKGQSFKEAGRDLFVFIQEGGKWQAVWRTLIPQA